MARRYVIDANIILALFLKLPYSQQVDNWVQERRKDAAIFIVPVLWEYECLAGFRRVAKVGQITNKAAEIMMENLLNLDIQSVQPSNEIHLSALRWAERIGQSRAYDGQYLALAESLSAEFWTADKRLANVAKSLKISWVHNIEELPG